jgi:transcriptional regulator of aromatic amino acid metabolism
MKRLVLLFSLLFATVVAMQGQQAFHDAVLDYIKACPSATVSINASMKGALQMMNKQIIKNYNQQRSDKLVERYLEGPFLEHMVDKLLAPMFQKHATVEDLKFLTSKFLTPKGKLFQEHQTKMNAVGVSLVEQKCGNAMEQILAGQAPQSEQPRQDIPKSYQKLYSKFYKASKLNETIAPILATLSRNAGADKEDILNKFQDYMTANMETMYMNMSYNYMTTNDLKFGMKLFGSDAYQHVLAAMNEMPKMAQSGGMDVVMAYIQWLSEQGVELKM